MTDERQMPEADATAQRLHQFFQAESHRSQEQALAIAQTAMDHRRSRPVVRMAPLGGGIAILAILAIALVALPLRNVPAGQPGASGAAVGNVSQSPSSTATLARVRYSNGVPVEISGERVYHGDEIASRKAQPGSFLVTGKLSSGALDCMTGMCPASSVWFLSDPTSTTLNLGGVPLLIAGKVWAPDNVPYWPGNLVVLRVRGYDASCPWGQFCGSSLLVESTVGE